MFLHMSVHKGLGHAWLEERVWLARGHARLGACIARWCAWLRACMTEQGGGMRG